MRLARQHTGRDEARHVFSLRTDGGTRMRMVVVVIAGSTSKDASRLQ